MPTSARGWSRHAARLSVARFRSGGVALRDRAGVSLRAAPVAGEPVPRVRRAEWSAKGPRRSVAVAVRRILHDVEAGRWRVEPGRKPLGLASEFPAIDRGGLRQVLRSIFRMSRVAHYAMRGNGFESNAVIGDDESVTAPERARGAIRQARIVTVERLGR